MARVMVTDISVDSVLADAEVINMTDADGGRFSVPSGSSLTTITWHTSSAADGTFVPAYDENGSAVTQTVAASRSYPLPVTLNAAAFLKAVGNADGTITLTRKMADSRG